MQNDDLIPELDAAPYIGRHPQTLRKLRREGALPIRYLKVGGRYFYRRADLDQYLQSCEVDPEQKAAAG